MILRFLSVLGALACFILASAIIAGAFAAEQHACTAVDGDTLACGPERIRIIGLDTPETYQPQCAEEARLGYQAAGRLQHLLHLRSVRIERLGKADKYGRTLARVYVGQDDVAAILVGEGLARPYSGGKRQPWCPQGKAREAAY